MRTVQNQLRQQVNRLHMENNKLSVQVTRLQTQTERYASSIERWLLTLCLLLFGATNCQRTAHYDIVSFHCQNSFAVLLLRLAEEEAKLEQIVKEQGSNVASFMGLVDENAKTVKELKVIIEDVPLICSNRAYFCLKRRLILFIFTCACIFLRCW